MYKLLFTIVNICNINMEILKATSAETLATINYFISKNVYILTLKVLLFHPFMAIFFNTYFIL